jgi:hypothetical protein
MSEPMKSAILRAENTAVARVKNRARLDAWNHTWLRIGDRVTRPVRNRVRERVRDV